MVFRYVGGGQKSEKSAYVFCVRSLGKCISFPQKFENSRTQTVSSGPIGPNLDLEV
jgi:hypothetical protein